jgi:hypothetical protein
MEGPGRDVTNDPLGSEPLGDEPAREAAPGQEPGPGVQEPPPGPATPGGDARDEDDEGIMDKVKDAAQKAKEAIKPDDGEDVADPGPGR